MLNCLQLLVMFSLSFFGDFFNLNWVGNTVLGHLCSELWVHFIWKNLPPIILNNLTAVRYRSITFSLVRFVRSGRSKLWIHHAAFCGAFVRLNCACKTKPPVYPVSFASDSSVSKAFLRHHCETFQAFQTLASVPSMYFAYLRL